MKTMKLFPILVVTILLMGVSVADAKRDAPKEVEPVIYNGMKYVVQHFKVVGKEVHRNYIEAWNVRSNKLLWEIQVYTTDYDPKLERDVQDVFITSLTINNGNLVVVNEHNEIYEVNLQTRRISKMKEIGLPSRPEPTLDLIGDALAVTILVLPCSSVVNVAL